MAVTLQPTIAVVVLVVAAGLLVTVGVRFTRLADELADRTGLGEAIAGALLLGATTSLPGLVTTVLAASSGDAGLAVGNAVGGIAAQTAFLAIADLRYRPANLEHAAVSVANLVQTMVLVALVGIVLAATGSPDVTLLGVHPATVLLLAVYLYGLRLARDAGASPMWRPERTGSTVVDEPDEEHSDRTIGRLWAEFGAAAVVVSATGWAVGTAGVSLAAQTGLSGSVVGALLTAVVTSLPELVTVLVAVRIGAPQLAVGNIVGGNTFDVLFVAAADVAFRDGSVYHATPRSSLFLLALVVVLVAVLAAGLLKREERGVGFEGVAILLFYGLGVVGLVAIG